MYHRVKTLDDKWLIKGGISNLKEGVKTLLFL
jgi:hypothetical protein